ncbi:MAG TPA: sulfatase-like hydrolase/transferase [Vicinamibacteria bacterium]|nr:sulfatase-like hydrolase/transferase [Vicinamibacteria bacterium]
MAAILLGLGAWGMVAARAVHRDQGLSVLLVSIDTLRADAVGAYGNKTVATPWIDRLAQEGVRFDRVHAHNVITFPSHANMLSGRLPLQHGVRDNSGYRYPANEPTLATVLKAAGWRTGAFVSAFPLDSRFGLDVGFEVYDDRLGGAETGGLRAFMVPERHGPLTVASALKWLDPLRGGRTFTFVHLYEPHFPYEPPEPFASRFRSDPYHGEVSAADAALEPLLRPLLEKGEAARTLVILTSDHGESLGEHGEQTHGIFAYEATLRVPLILWAPGHLPGGRTVSTPVRHVDLVPTILDLLQLTPPADLEGRSLLPLVGREGEATPVYFEALSSSMNQGWAPLRGVVRDGLKYVDLPLPELYDLAADPAEAKNLVASRPEQLEALRGLLGRFQSRDRGSARQEEDAATIEKLRALGYVGGGQRGPKERYTAADDPKNLVEVDTRNREVIRLFRAGEIDKAIEVCRANLEQRPNMPLAWIHMGFLERARGNLKGAIAAVHRAFELKPLDGEAANLYAVYLTEAGRAREALEFLDPLLKAVRPDVDLLTAKAMALATVGKADEALATFAQARELDPTNGMVLVNSGIVYLQAGDRTRARQSFEAALDIDPGIARAQSSLGVIASMEGRDAEAVERWKRALALQPDDYQTLYNLGLTLRKQGRLDEARTYLEAYLRTAPRALEGRDMARVEAWLRGSAAGS